MSEQGLGDLKRMARMAESREDFMDLMRACWRHGIFPSDEASVQWQGYIPYPNGRREPLKNRPYTNSGHVKNSMRHRGPGYYLLHKYRVFQFCEEETWWAVEGGWSDRKVTKVMTPPDDPSDTE
jgi:hypothetical protein